MHACCCASAQDVGGTLLHHASLHGHAAVVRLLLAHGADVDAEDEVRTPACTSALAGCDDRWL